MIEIFLVFLRLGLTSFGGPTAHVGYFRTECVVRRGWLSEADFAERLALAQFLPGPASSQLGFAIGLHRGGAAGALAAFAGFTLPSAVLMALAGLWALSLPQAGPGAGALAGLALVAFAVVAQALWGMARSLCPDTPRRILALAGCAWAIWAPLPSAHLIAIALAAALGFAQPARFGAPPAPPPAPMRAPLWLGAVLLGLCAALLLVPLARPYLSSGALVFGGGHVVLPLLREALGGMEDARFFTGYGLAQAMPGPLFTFASYLGAVQAGVWGALLATAAIFAPGFALMAMVLPLWARLGQALRLRGAVAAVNAAVVGVLGAALATQLAPHAIASPGAAAVSLALLTAAFLTRLPPVALVGLGASLGAVLLAP